MHKAIVHVVGVEGESQAGESSSFATKVANSEQQIARDWTTVYQVIETNRA
jgi:hypothetical protein